MILSEKDMRDAFFDELYAYGAANKNVVIITNDMDVFSLRKFKKEYPDQFINVGVSEQNMVNVAAGLASCGKRVFIYGITSFVTFRCYEQIRFHISSMNLPIVIVGMGPGFSFEFDGPTHHGVNDISVMGAIPGMTILNPCDSVSASKCMQYIIDNPGPTYVRIDKGMSPQIYDETDTIDDGYKIVRPKGKADFWLRCLAPQHRELGWNILTTGRMVSIAKIVADRLSAGVVDILRLKPINQDCIFEMASSANLITIEEHSAVGGLGSIVANCLSDTVYTPKMIHINLGDSQCFYYGKRDWLLKQHGIDADSIIERIESEPKYYS